jgi:pyridoxal 5'-phosphate synthase pdxT subunit
MRKVGVLALQGAFVEHAAILHQLGVEAPLVRLVNELEGLDGLIIPGGESTTIARLMLEYELMDKIKRLAQEGFPLMGTCAGMVLLSKRASDLNFEPIGAIDIEVRRNAFGRQVDSFETDILIPALGNPPFHCIFIRAPFIEKAGPEVEILAKLPDGTGIAARQGKIIVSAFHPELTPDLRFHRYFLNSS